jgi:hypothetical protein
VQPSLFASLPVCYILFLHHIPFRLGTEHVKDTCLLCVLTDSEATTVQHRAAGAATLHVP